MSKPRFKIKSKRPQIRVRTAKPVKTEDEILEQELQNLVEGREVKRTAGRVRASGVEDDPEWEDLDEEVVKPKTDEEFEQRIKELSVTAESLVKETKKLLDEQERQEIDLDIEEAHLLNSQAKEEHKQKVADVDIKSTQLFERKVNELREEASAEHQLKVAQLKQIEEERKLQIQREKSVSAKKLQEQIDKLKDAKDKEQRIEALKQKEVKALKLKVQKVDLEAKKKKDSILHEITSIDANLDTQIARLSHQINSTKRKLINSLDHELEQSLKENNKKIQEAQERLSALDGWDVVKEEDYKEAAIPKKKVVDEVGASPGVSRAVEPDRGLAAPSSIDMGPELDLSHGMSMSANPAAKGMADEFQRMPSRTHAPLSHDVIDEGLIGKLQASKDYKEAMSHWDESMKDSDAQKKAYVMHSEKKDNGIHTITWVDPSLTEEQRKNPDFHVIYKIDQKTGVLSSIESGCNVACSIPPIPRSEGGFDVVSINKGKVSLPVQRDGGVSALSIKAHSKPFNSKSTAQSTSERTEAQKAADKYADYGISLMVESPGAGPRVSDMASRLAEAYGADKKDMEARILSNVDKLKAVLKESKRESKSTGSPSSPSSTPGVSAAVQRSREQER